MPNQITITELPPDPVRIYDKFQVTVTRNGGTETQVESSLGSALRLARDLWSMLRETPPSER